MLSRKGTPIQVCSALMGHESILTTAKYYIDISDEEKKDAIATIKI
jgi:integrase